MIGGTNLESPAFQSCCGVKNPLKASASLEWLGGVRASQGQGMVRGGSGVPGALWMSTETILEAGQASLLSLPLETILMVSFLVSVLSE